MAHDVFVSYASPDKPTADAICARLEEQGVRCWYAPRDIPPGASWPDSILAALEHAQIMVLVFSAHANESEDVAREVELAAGRKMTIIPVRIEEVTPTKGMDYFLSRPHWLDALTPPLKEHIDRLAQAIKPLLGQPAGSSPVPEAGKDPSPLEPKRRLRVLILALVPIALIAMGAWYFWDRQVTLEGARQAPPQPAEVKRVTVPAKSFSIPLDTTIEEVNGRIDFYLNMERLPDEAGKAKYRDNRGTLQIVIPIMKGSRMVGVQREVIFSTTEGELCRLTSLSETTGHLKAMRVRNSLRLASCRGAESPCQAEIVPPGKRVHIELGALPLTISKSCR